jgi:hypothetical protein
MSIVTFGSVSNASDQLLANFSTDGSPVIYQLSAISSGQDHVLTRLAISKALGDISIKSREISIDDFIRDGLSLYQTGIQNLTKIYGHNLNEEEGGIIILDSLIQSSDNNEKFYQLELSKANGKWSLQYKGKSITTIHATLGVTGMLDLVME